MVGTRQYNEFLMHAKLCSSHMAFDYVRWTNAGRDTYCLLTKLRMLRSYIKTLESFCRPERKVYFDFCEPCEIEVETCLDCSEICNLVKKISSICNC
jgi:hypothetical protein